MVLNKLYWHSNSQFEETEEQNNLPNTPILHGILDLCAQLPVNLSIQSNRNVNSQAQEFHLLASKQLIHIPSVSTTYTDVVSSRSLIPAQKYDGSPPHINPCPPLPHYPRAFIPPSKPPQGLNRRHH